jgi:hypothetical protein
MSMLSGWPTAHARLSETRIRKNKRHMSEGRLFFRILVSL